MFFVGWATLVKHANHTSCMFWACATRLRACGQVLVILFYSRTMVIFLMLQAENNNVFVLIEQTPRCRTEPTSIHPHPT